MIIKKFFRRYRYFKIAGLSIIFLLLLAFIQRERVMGTEIRTIYSKGDLPFGISFLLTPMEREGLAAEFEDMQSGDMWERAGTNLGLMMMNPTIGNLVDKGEELLRYRADKDKRLQDMQDLKDTMRSFK